MELCGEYERSMLCLALTNTGSTNFNLKLKKIMDYGNMQNACIIRNIINMFKDSTSTSAFAINRRKIKKLSVPRLLLGQ